MFSFKNFFVKPVWSIRNLSGRTVCGSSWSDLAPWRTIQMGFLCTDTQVWKIRCLYRYSQQIYSDILCINIFICYIIYILYIYIIFTIILSYYILIYRYSKSKVGWINIQPSTKVAPTMIQGYIQGLWKHTQTRKGLFASYHWGHLVLGLFKFPYHKYSNMEVS